MKIFWKSYLCYIYKMPFLWQSASMDNKKKRLSQVKLHKACTQTHNNPVRSVRLRDSDCLKISAKLYGWAGFEPTPEHYSTPSWFTCLCEVTCLNNIEIPAKINNWEAQIVIIQELVQTVKALWTVFMCPLDLTSSWLLLLQNFKRCVDLCSGGIKP